MVGGQNAMGIIDFLLCSGSFYAGIDSFLRFSSNLPCSSAFFFVFFLFLLLLWCVIGLQHELLSPWEVYLHGKKLAAEAIS